MNILGIETSCDETSAAVVQSNNEKQVTLLSNVIASSLELHIKTGGIIPEEAAREQLKFIIPVIKQALAEAEMELSNIDALAVTYGPGLIGSLLVGVETMKTMAYVLQKPLIPVNHMLGHVYANWLYPKDKKPQEKNYLDIPFPAIALVVSGGHTDLLLLKGHGDLQLLGGTRDDAAGECFDKCARLLGYNYPGGPHISKLAEKGDPKAFPFPRPMLGSKDYEFSFSGLKTAFLNATKQHFPILRTNTPNSKVGWQQVALEKQLSPQEKQTLYDLCASLQKAIVDVLIKKTIKAATQYNVKAILISGGVSANQMLRDDLEIQCQKNNVQLYVPPRNLCTDNAAMIASAAFYNYAPIDWNAINADPELYF